MLVETDRIMPITKLQKELTQTVRELSETGEAVYILKNNNMDEPPRDCRRPQSLRGYGHGQRNTVFTRGERAGSSAGIRATEGF